MPFRPVLPAAARANIVSRSDSNWSAGRTSQTKRTGSDLEAKLPRRDGEALALGGVDVRGGNEPTWLDDGLDHDRVAVGVRRGGDEGDALAGDRVLDGVACKDHLCLLASVTDIREARTPGLKNRRPTAGSSVVSPGDLRDGAPPPCEGARLARRKEA
jgi:hypothetical protein